MKNWIIDNLKTLFYALILAIIIRSFLFQPFYIPSSSMEPTLLPGDRIFVSKYTYGYSKHSFPFSPNIFGGRFFFNKPQRGDIIVFKTPADNRTDYIKRLIGLPGDTIQFIDSELYLNSKKINKERYESSNKVYCGDDILNVNFYKEFLSKESYYNIAYKKRGSLANTNKFVVPDKHYFFMGDNRDCSKDSRFLGSVGYVSYENIIGKARIIFFSNNVLEGRFLEFWKWKKSLNYERFFKKIK